ncbi:MAG: VOC family protein [Acidobacteria bacterium]|nr:MAG: VOC family protein [Acidobacteriota bacterium]REK01100.1 MAG: VOC family protein [Acidobacteriota bacterium]
MSLDPYLHFNGDCREAFEHYRAVFGGEFEVLQTFGDGPDEMQVADQDKARVMHVSLPLGSSTLMGSDVPTSFPGGPVTFGNNVHVSYSPASRAECDRQFAALSEGGEVTMPLQEAFWGSYFGSCTDRFGVHWMFNHRGE